LSALLLLHARADGSLAYSYLTASIVQLLPDKQPIGGRVASSGGHLFVPPCSPYLIRAGHLLAGSTTSLGVRLGVRFWRREPSSSRFQSPATSSKRTGDNLGRADLAESPLLAGMLGEMIITAGHAPDLLLGLLPGVRVRIADQDDRAQTGRTSVCCTARGLRSLVQRPGAARRSTRRFSASALIALAAFGKGRAQFLGHCFNLAAWWRWGSFSPVIWWNYTHWLSFAYSFSMEPQSEAGGRLRFGWVGNPFGSFGNLATYPWRAVRACGTPVLFCHFRRRGVVSSRRYRRLRQVDRVLLGAGGVPLNLFRGDVVNRPRWKRIGLLSRTFRDHLCWPLLDETDPATSSGAVGPEGSGSFGLLIVMCVSRSKIAERLVRLPYPCHCAS